MKNRISLTAIKKIDLVHLCYFMKEGAKKAKQPFKDDYQFRRLEREWRAEDKTV